MKRLFKVEVEVVFNTCRGDVLVWAENETEAEELVEADYDCVDVDPDVDTVTAELVEDAELSDVDQAERYKTRVVGDDGSFSWAAAREAAREEDRARALWEAQAVIPGMPRPPLPERCESCGGRPPLSPHTEDCDADARP